MSKSRSGAPRRVAAGLLAGALAVFGVALAPPAGAVDDVVADRVAGPTRYSTAGAIAGQADFDGATTAILATGENFPDALAASGLAGANAPAPIILTQSNTLTEDAVTAMTQLESLDDVLIVGGTAAISEEVATGVEDAGYSVTRLAGVNRYATAAAIAAETTAGEVDGLRTAIIASGEVFADAVAGGPIAYAGQHPILLVNTAGVPAETAAALDDEGIEQVLILGGTARITDSTETELEGITGNPAVRVAGVDRFETAADIARFAEAELGWGPNEVLLANGLNFPDALACGPLGGERSAPIVLTASIPEPTATYLDEVSNSVERITACGGTAAVSAEDLTAAEGLGETTENDADAPGSSQTAALDGPELQDCGIAGLDLDDLEIVFSYEFDEEIDEDSVDEGGFLLYDAYNVAPSSGDSFGEEGDVDDNTVFITFSLADLNPDQANILSASLCAVSEGAVEDEDGNVNPPQSVSVGSDRSGTGATNGLDLIDANITEDDLTDEDDDEWTVEYVFDLAAVDPAGINSGAFTVITRFGEEIGADSCETTPEDDEASDTVECTFLEGDFIADTNGEDIRDAVRAVAYAGAVNTFGNNTQVAELSSSGNSQGPDLVSVEVDEDDDAETQVTFRFDEDIVTSTDASAFELYYADCQASPFGQSFCSISGDSIESVDEDEVVVNFPSDAANQFLAGAVAYGGAVEADIDDVDVNDDSNTDEVGLTTSFESGVVAGPQLSGVEITVDTNVSGFFDEFQVELTFTEDLDEGSLSAGTVAVWYTDEDDNVQRFNIDTADCDVDDNVVSCTDDDPESEIGLATVVSVDAGAVFGEELFNVSFLEGPTQLPNPEASFEVEVPDFDVDPDDV